eukprot:scaffold479_cov123-Chaetoceros_neogracile.AAC.2
MATCTRPLCLQGPGCNGKGEKFKLGGNGIRKRNSKMDSASFIPLIEADRGNRISPSVWHTTAIDTPGTTASCTPRARQGGGNGSGGGRYGGARQGGGGRGDRQGGGGSGRYGDDHGGRSVLGMRSGKGREAKVFDHHFSASSRAISGLWNCTLCSKGSLDESAAEVHMNCAGHRSKMETLSHFGDESSTKKKREEEEKRLAEQKCAEKAIKLAEQKCAEEAAAKKIIEEAEAVQRQRRLLKGAILPSVEKLVYHLLISTQKDDPNPECARAESTNYDAALATLLEENLAGMMEMLFAIQRFCNEIGFPKVGTEGLIQAMFRSVYKFDL